jgi:hypothetical protein
MPFEVYREADGWFFRSGDDAIGPFDSKSKATECAELEAEEEAACAGLR